MASLGPLRTDDGRDGEPEVGEGDEAEGEADEEGVSSIVEADTQARAAVAPPPSPPCAAGKLLHQRHKKLRADLSACKYEAVREAMEQLGWEILAPADEGEVADDSWNIYWTDVSVSQERVTRLRPLQRINHFPGMLELARKAGTARNLNRMLERYPNEYKIFPPTWLLPADLTDFKAQFTAKRNKTFIVKPSRGCQGKDIMLTRSLEGISLHENYIAQRYMHRPYLLDGYKFDLRIYVLLTSVEPLRVYLHTEGMVRICTSKYGPVTGSNLEDQCMHLTNYAINKHADGYVPAASSNDNGSHKRLLSSLLAHLSARGEDVPRLVQLMREAVVKCLIAVQPHLAHNYYACQQRRENPGSSCFELLGFDILLDHRLKPYLLEVNHSPSFTVDSPLDAHLKHTVLTDTLALVSFSRDEVGALRRQRPGRLEPGMLERLREMRAAYEDERVGRTGFERLYPNPPDPPAGLEPPRYEEFLKGAAQLFAHASLNGSRRTSCAAERGADNAAGTRTARAVAGAPLNPVAAAGLPAGAPGCAEKPSCAPGAGVSHGGSGCGSGGSGGGGGGGERAAQPDGCDVRSVARQRTPCVSQMQPTMAARLRTPPGTGSSVEARSGARGGAPAQSALPLRAAGESTAELAPPSASGASCELTVERLRQASEAERVVGASQIWRWEPSPSEPSLFDGQTPRVLALAEGGSFGACELRVCGHAPRGASAADTALCSPAS